MDCVSLNRQSLSESILHCMSCRFTRLSGGRLLGRFFAGSREKLRLTADRLGVRHLVNLQGFTAS